jgi:Raf kinase inhibitor-like YbhB/YbcL family protein
VWSALRALASAGTTATWRSTHGLRYTTHVDDFALTSAAFQHGDPIPRRHSCEGEDVSPPLTWSGPPAGTRSLALIVDDPDAPVGTFTHWLGWGIDPGSRGPAAGEPAPVEGRNDFRTTGYRGPCPPRGHGPHRYVFRLFALDAALELRPGKDRADVERAANAHNLAVAELVGVYER